jgi:hypothetical protein
MWRSARRTDAIADTPVGQMAVLHDLAGAVFAIGQFTAIDDPNDWPA